jgi:hypothetical protein
MLHVQRALVVFVITGHVYTHVTEENSKTYTKFGMDLNLSLDSVT